MCLLQFRLGIFQAAGPHEKVAVPVVGGSGVGAELKRAFEFSFRSRPIPVVSFPNQSQGNVRLRQHVINLESLHGCGFSILPDLFRGNVASIP